MIDAHIIGAGPVGCFSAIYALKNGSDVLISEEHGEIGLPVKCSGLISKRAINFFSQEINVKKAIKKQFNEARLYFGKDKIELKTKKPIYLIDRHIFDNVCAEKAEELGAKIELNKKITNNHRANTILGADGPLSITADHFNFPKIRKFIATQQTVIKDKDIDKDIIQLYLSSKHIPGFFGWVIPKNEEEIELGVGVRIPNNSKKAMEYLKKKTGVKQNKQDLKLIGGLIPHEIRKRTFKKAGNKNSGIFHP